MKRISVKKNVCFKDISLLILLSVIFISFLLTNSISKYVSKENAKYQGESKVNFTVNSVFVVNTAEELFAAINQGYSYVQLDKSIENPLIITQKAENLNNDLILDLNGIEIQRNGYEPILNINAGTRLTIVDSSDEQTGGLYNPVGSVFNINGGVLTVVTGFFESGPRYSEYYTYNNLVLNNNATSLTKRTIVEKEQEVIFFDKEKETQSTIKAPIIKSYPTKTGDIEYNHGNLYFDEAVKTTGLNINADTYCYYRTSEDALFTESDTSMADWYYTYYVDPDTYTYTGYEENDERPNDIKVTIYGYENVIDNASNKTESKDYFAAIQMSSGELDVQEGAFYQYFGVDTTACVNASGGTININYGSFSSRVPDSTKYDANSVSVKETDKNAFDEEYFTNFYWYENSTNSKAKYGESYCILNSGNANVKIDEGKFYSSNNNIISMYGGELSIGGGSFTKKITNNLNSSIKNIYLSAINMESGKLTVKNSDFDISGNNTYAIYSTVAGEGNFSIIDSDFKILGNNATGIYSSYGKVEMKASISSKVEITGNGGKGIWVENGGSVSSDKYSYYLSGDKSYGIYSLSGTTDIKTGNIYLLSNNNCYGIYAESSGLVNVTVNNSNIAIGCNIENGEIKFNEKIPEFKETKKSGTVSASVGVFLSSENKESTLSIISTNIYSYELGAVSNGGTIELSNAGTIYTYKASAIAIRNGSISFNGDSNYTIVSSNTTDNSYQNSYTLTLPVRNAEGTLEDTDYVNTDGIYVNGGSFTSIGNLNITHTGLQNKTFSSGYDYNSLVVTSYAVRVYGGDVTIVKGAITAEIGGGIYSGKSTSDVGKVVLGSTNQSINESVKVRTKGKDVGASYNAIGKTISNWISHQSITGGHAVELDGGSITIYNGDYEAQFGNGIFVNGSSSNDNNDTGEITVYDGKFYGYMNNNQGNDLSAKSGPAAYYGLKVVGGSTTKIYGGCFGGGNGGAFVTGVTKIGNPISSYSSTALVYIYGGEFGSTDSEDGFNVYDGVNIVFGAYTETEINALSEGKIENLKNSIKLYGHATSISANSITNDITNIVKSKILVYYGTYYTPGTYAFNMYKDDSCDLYVYNTLEYVYNNGKLKFTVIDGGAITKGKEFKNETATWFSGSFDENIDTN